MTKVYNLATGHTAVFSLPPAEAVVAAFELARYNANHWQWPIPTEHPYYRRTAHGHNCGDWAALDN